LNDTVVDSLKRTLNNLIIESNNRVNKDNKYIRFIEVRKWIRSIKNGKDSVRIDSNIIKDFIKEFNSRFGNLYNPNKIDGVVNDLNDIFQVKKVIISGKSSYDISYEWTLENIRGISFAESRR
jgi:thermostable 8-oxoguanine DNA glycosylase